MIFFLFFKISLHLYYFKFCFIFFCCFNPDFSFINFFLLFSLFSIFSHSNFFSSFSSTSFRFSSSSSYLNYTNVMISSVFLVTSLLFSCCCFSFLFSLSRISEPAIFFLFFSFLFHLFLPQFCCFSLVFLVL